MLTDSDTSALEPSAYELRQSIRPPAAKLPTRLLRTVGRDETVQTISAQLPGQRFVSVVGPRGIEKTTVAVSVAHAKFAKCGGAAHFVDLGALDDPSLLPSAIASTLGLSVDSKGLRLSETLLAMTQRLSQTGSFAWNPSSGKIYWSDETYRILEYERSTTPAVELLRQRVHPEDVATVRELVERGSHVGREFTCEYRLLMPDGRVKHLHVVAGAIRYDKGDVDIVGAVKDVTEQKWAQTERERLGRRIRQAEKMEAVGRRVGGVAHDFNNVLAGMLAYGEMLFEETPEDSKLKRYAQNVLTAATRGRELVEQILTYSRTQRGARVPVDLASVVAETLELIRGSLPAGIRLEASAPEAPLVLIGDATQLHQVAMNLCSNAIQAMSTGGTLRVTLEAAKLPAQALSHGTLERGRYVRLIVADSGSGMDEKILARIFEPFFTTKEVGKGTGLGLSLVHSIITDSGGAIDVQSALRRGSTFTIYLPRNRQRTGSS